MSKQVFLSVMLVWSLVMPTSIVSQPSASTVQPSSAPSPIIPAFGLSSAPPLQGASAIVTGVNDSCAIIGGAVKCWGENDDGQLGDGTRYHRFAPTTIDWLSVSGSQHLALAGTHTCAVTGEGGVQCWGTNDYGQLGDGTITASLSPINVAGLAPGVTAVAAAYGYTCALAGGAVKCWGGNLDGQLGNGTTIDSATPVDVSGLTSGVAAIAAADVHVCVRTDAGGVKCWGNNTYGQLGDGTTNNSLTPVDATGLGGTITSISTTGSHTCALTQAGGVRCWGKNSDGQLGDGSTVDSAVPVDVSGLTSGVTAVAAGANHSCALTVLGGIKCWGDNSYGQLGDGTTTDSSLPVDVSGLSSGVTAIGAGWSHSCALTDGGGVKCWGNNPVGQLGDGSSSLSSIPVDIGGLASGVSAFSNGDKHTCLVSEAGGVKCWGRNNYGQLGNGTTTGSFTPVGVSGLPGGGDPAGTATAVAAGSEHTCALTAGGEVKCWGRNDYGQLGNGTTTHSSVPVSVNGLPAGIKGIRTGSIFSCALTAAGGVMCWGANSFGQLGNGTTTGSTTPVDVSGLSSSVTAITAGSYHACALAGGAVKCWGWNGRGQVGDGTLLNRTTPVDVSGLSSGVDTVAAGYHYTCAALSGGGAKCWGFNFFGQLGNGSTTNSSLPVDVSGLTGIVTEIAAGLFHTCAITGEALRCWGDNQAGQLGDGTLTGQTTPAEATGMAGNVTAITLGGQHTCALAGTGRVKCWGDNSTYQIARDSTLLQATPVDVIDAAQPELSINYPDGSPGSFFTLTGNNFLPNSTISVMAGGPVITDTLATSEGGGFILFIDTAGASPRTYSLTAGSPSGPTVSFDLAESAPLRVQEGGGDIAGILDFIDLAIYLPLVSR